MELANDGQVKIVFDADVDTSKLKNIDKEVEKSTRKSRITIDEFARQNNITFEQAKQKIDALAEGYVAEGKRVQDAYKRVYRELGVLSEDQEKKLKKEKESLKGVGESAEDTADSMGDLSNKTDKATSSTKNLEKSTENTVDSMGDLSTTASKATSSTENLGKKAVTAAKNTEQQGESSKEAAKNTKYYGEENKDAAKKTGTLSDAAEKAKKVTKKFGSAIKEAGELAKKANKALTSTLKVFQGLASFSVSAFRMTAMGVATGMTTIATAATGLIGMGTAYNAEIEQYRTSFEVMTGSAEKAYEVVETLKKMGAETPFELSDLAQATQLLMNYGFTADDAIDRMTMLGDISQGDTDKLLRVATAYGQMSSAGKVSLEDVKQMIEAGFNPLQEISESTGETMASLYERISKGTISVDEITDSMKRSTSEGGKYFQSMIKQSKTFSGQLSTLKDNFKSFTGVMAEAATGSKANDFFPLLNESLTTLEDALTSGGFSKMASVFGKELSKFVSMGLSYIPDLMDLGTDIMDSIVDGFLSGESSLEKATRRIFKKLPAFIKNNIDTGFKFGSELIQLITKGINDNTSGISNAVSHMIASFVGFLEQNAPFVKEAATNLINALADAITADSDKITSSVFSVLTLIPQFIAENIDTISKVIVSFIQNISNGINENKNLLKESASTIVNALAYGLADLIEIGLGIVTDLIDILSEAIEKNETAFKDAVSRVIGALVKFITNNIKPFVNAAITIIRAFVSGLSDPENVRLVSGAVVDIISLIGTVISQNLSDFLGAALTIITEIAEGLKSENASEKLTEAISVVLNSIVDAVTDNIDLLTDAATSIVSFIMDDLLTPENINKIIDGASEFIDKINNELLSDENVDKMLNTGGEIIRHIVDGIGRAILNIDWNELLGILPDIISFLINPAQYLQNKVTGKLLSPVETYVNNELFKGTILAEEPEEKNLEKKKKETKAKKQKEKYESAFESMLINGSVAETIQGLKDAQQSLQSGIASNVTNNSTVNNSNNATYNTTNYNTFEVRNDQDIKRIEEMIQSDTDSNRKGRGY